MSVYEQRRKKIAQYAKRADDYNNQAQSLIADLTSKGYTIENMERVVNVRNRIDEILKKSKPTERDLQLMKEFARSDMYDYVKANVYETRGSETLSQPLNFREIRLGFQREADRPSKLTERQQNFLEQYNDSTMRGELRRASLVNEAINYAASIYGGNSEYTKFLMPLIYELSDIHPIKKAGEENEYYKIDKNTGNLNELFKHVDFKRLPDTPEINAYITQILHLPWSSEENYKAYLNDIHHRSYNTLINTLNINQSNASVLEHIMNSSSAWTIAKRGAQDSEQVKENWVKLYSKVENLQQTGDTSNLNRIITMIENNERLDTIISTVDDIIAKAIKGE